MTIISYLKNFYILRVLTINTILFVKKFKSGKKSLTVNNKGCARIKKDVIGNNNSLIIGKDCFLKTLNILIRGNNNSITIGEKCHFGPGCVLRIEGNDCMIKIGANTSATRIIEINVQESNRKIIIGEDCMFSNRIVVRTSDSHPMYDIASHTRLNPAKDVIIGNHVWIAPNTKIMKGANIGDGCIVGSDSTLNKTYPSNSLIVGRPAKVVKEGVEWTRENLF